MEIQINGHSVLIDECDLDVFNKHLWQVRVFKDYPYVCLEGGWRPNHFLHQILMGVRDGLEIIHRNGKTLDNRRSNLVHVTRSIVQHRKNMPNNKTGFRGVRWHRGQQRYVAQIGFDGKTFHIGSFFSPEDAARAYDDKARELFGDLARLNYA